MKIAIIGAGITGLSAAYELGKKGHEVVVFERSQYPGGLGNYIKLPSPNLYMVNIDRMFPYDRNLNQGIELGKKAASLI